MSVAMSVVISTRRPTARQFIGKAVRNAWKPECISAEIERARRIVLAFEAAEAEGLIALDDLPLFDTGEIDFSFSQMFSDNRFSGADRHGDADQLTLALTSRLLDDRNGKERLRGSIGQIHYFRDREVTLKSCNWVNRNGLSHLLYL